MDNNKCKSFLENQFDFFFPVGRSETHRIVFRRLGLNLCHPPSPRLLQPLPLGSSSFLKPNFGRCSAECTTRLWDTGSVPLAPYPLEKLQDTWHTDSKKFAKSFLASWETTVYRMEIHVLMFDFLLPKHSLGLRLAWAQLLVVYTGYWLFTLGQYTGRAVYTRPATNSTAWSVSTTAALLYVQSWKEIKSQLWK